MGNKKEEELLADCYTNSLKLAEENGCTTIAFPNISTGIYKFPKDKAAKIAINTVQNFLANSKIEKVIFACFDEENYQLLQQNKMFFIDLNVQ